SENQRREAIGIGSGRNDVDSRRRILDGKPGRSHDGREAMAPCLRRWLLDGQDGGHQRAVRPVRKRYGIRDVGGAETARRRLSPSTPGETGRRVGGVLATGSPG